MPQHHWSALALLVSVLGAPLLQPLPPGFTPLQPELFAAGATLTNAAADYDGDNDADLFVGFNGLPNRLYRNTGGKFEDVGAAVGLASTRPTRAAAWGDLDADGDPDLVVGFAPGGGSVLVVYRNDGGRFAEITSTLGVAQDSGAVRQLSMIDVDGDDDLDLFVAFRDRPNALFEQQANGRFANVAAARGLADPRRSVGAVWFDYEQDGDLDVYVGNMDGDANGLFRNVNGQFTDVAEQAGAAWAGRTPREPTNGTVRPCAADVNGDGRLDLFGANYGRNGLLLARADGTLEDVSAAWRVNIEAKFDACAFADVDHDGRLDLYVNGTVTGGVSYRDYLLRNTGAGFEDVTPASLASLGADHGVQWVDVDRNGALDLALTGTADRGLHGVWMSGLPKADALRSLQVRVTNPRGRSLRAGAEVLVYAAGSRRLLGMRLVDSGSGYDAQSDVPVHFGLPATLPRRAALDVAVLWPAAGRRDTTWMRNVRPTNQPGGTVQVQTKHNTPSTVGSDSSADVRAIVAARARSNVAIARHDTVGIAREMMPDVTVMSSTSSMATGAAPNVSRMAAQFARRPDTRWVRTAERITVFDAWGVASERGQWVGTWTEPDGPIVIRGSYEAQWRRVDGLWRIQGELFVPLRCEGGAYCRARP